MGNKTFKSIDEQIEIFRDKGLLIDDSLKTKNILLRENYFFISGYRKLFMLSGKSKQFISGTTFDELYGVFLFDRRLRNTMFKFILIVENNIKSIMSHILSKKYGIDEKDYLEPRNFTPDHYRSKQVHDVLNKVKRQLKNNGKEHTATAHYLNHHGFIPLWILVKVLSFGIVSEFYSILKNDDQQDIANFYDMDTETLCVYLSILANYRNLCAHEDILFERRTQRKIPDSKYHQLLKIDQTNDEYVYGKNDLFALIIIMKRMLSEDEFKELMFEISYEVDILSGKIKVVEIPELLNKIGFPNNWRDILNV